MLAGLIADNFNDPTNARLIYLGAGALAALGVALIVLTRWWWVTTRRESPALGPLEVMSGRRWRRSSEPQRVAALERARLRTAAGVDDHQRGPFEMMPSAAGDDLADSFDDLRADVEQPPSSAPASVAAPTESGTSAAPDGDAIGSESSDAGPAGAGSDADASTPAGSEADALAAAAAEAARDAVDRLPPVVSAPSDNTGFDATTLRPQRPRTIEILTAPPSSRGPAVRPVQPGGDAAGDIADEPPPRTIDPLLRPRPSS